VIVTKIGDDFAQIPQRTRADRIFQTHQILILPARRRVLIRVFRDGDPVVQVDFKITHKHIERKTRAGRYIKLAQILMLKIFRITDAKRNIQTVF